MAKPIGDLPAASGIGANDKFVLEQSEIAKSLTGQILLNWLTAAADGHGGIQSIAKISTSGLVDTYRITLADTTIFDLPVTNGRSITGISKTGTSGLVDTHTIKYNDGTTSTFTVTNGKKGDKGDNAYTWIKYASQEPTESSHSMGDVPDAWRGEYNGPLSSPPTDWKQYKWYKIKGDKGNTGYPATLESSASEYQVGDSGETVPTGSWSTTIPAVAQGKYLWTRVTQTFNTGDPVVFYSAARNGIDGSGSVSSVNNVSPDANGNVSLTAANVGALPTSGGTMTGPIAMGGNKVTGLATPTADADAATKSYADKMLPKTGGTMTGPIAMGGNKVTGLGVPTADADAVNKGSLLNLIYPIGAIYISTAATSPATLFGGTWERLKDRFLLAAGDTYAAGATGGSETHDHTLDSGFAKITFDYNTSLKNFFAEEYVYSSETYSSNKCEYMSGVSAFSPGTSNTSKATKLGGSTDEADNMPPYLAVYMWVRTA